MNERGPCVYCSIMSVRLYPRTSFLSPYIFSALCLSPDSLLSPILCCWCRPSVLRSDRLRLRRRPKRSRGYQTISKAEYTPMYVPTAWLNPKVMGGTVFEFLEVSGPFWRVLLFVFDFLIAGFLGRCFVGSDRLVIPVERLFLKQLESWDAFGAVLLSWDRRCVVGFWVLSTVIAERLFCVKAWDSGEGVRWNLSCVKDVLHKLILLLVPVWVCDVLIGWCYGVACNRILGSMILRKKTIIEAKIELS